MKGVPRLEANFRLTQRGGQSLRFFFVGGVLAIIGLTIFASLVTILGSSLHYWLIFVFSSLLVYTLNYVVYSRAVFAMRLNWQSFFEYLAGSVLNFVLTSTILILLVDLAGLEPIPARVLTALILAPAAFFFHSGLTFRDKALKNIPGREETVSRGH